MVIWQTGRWQTCLEVVFLCIIILQNCVNLYKYVHVNLACLKIIWKITLTIIRIPSDKLTFKPKFTSTELRSSPRSQISDLKWWEDVSKPRLWNIFYRVNTSDDIILNHGPWKINKPQMNMQISVTSCTVSETDYNYIDDITIKSLYPDLKPYWNIYCYGQSL